MMLKIHLVNDSLTAALEQGLLVEVGVDKEHIRAHSNDDEDRQAHHQANLPAATGQHEDGQGGWNRKHHQEEPHYGQEWTSGMKCGIDQDESIGHDGLMVLVILMVHHCDDINSGPNSTGKKNKNIAANMSLKHYKTLNKTQHDSFKPPSFWRMKKIKRSL